MSTSQAQKLNVGANLSGAFPMGDFGDYYSFGFGGNLSLDYYFNDRFNLGLETGYRGFPVALSHDAIAYIPLLLTGAVHQDVGDMVELYGELGVGAFFGGSVGSDVNTTELGLSPRLGLAYEMSPAWFLDANICYSVLFPENGDASWLGVNIGILYTLDEY